ncbi:MAG: class IIb bacteriocin, lactobin A/cerein 7B family [Prevotellaceae bacterium]|jgi:lactobin A/cerein 7B family class IIb bacteriocin|nr:class IIb bacteriocin, lactobin A/cerein 7B family [Prevotellaceae bacterium]
MKTLDLNAYGVHEMNAEEMMEIDGGLAWWIALGALIVGAVLLAWAYGYIC